MIKNDDEKHDKQNMIKSDDKNMIQIMIQHMINTYDYKTYDKTMINMMIQIMIRNDDNNDAK